MPLAIPSTTAITATQYYLNGSTILTQITGDDRFDFFYDENGLLLGFSYNGAKYYYIRNQQSDIIGILDNSGNQVVSYMYDSWGKLLSIEGSAKDTIGVQNPFRYRGYYYDTETELYYLNSRYYDPGVGRFLNADIIKIYYGVTENFGYSSPGSEMHVLYGETYDVLNLPANVFTAAEITYAKLMEW